MKQIDEVAQTCCETPHDKVGRQALSDMLRADEEYELADAVQSNVGEALLRATAALSTQTRLPVSVRLIWATYTLVPRMSYPNPATHWGSWNGSSVVGGAVAMWNGASDSTYTYNPTIGVERARWAEAAVKVARRASNVTGSTEQPNE